MSPVGSDRVQPAAGGAVCLRPPQLRLRDPGGLRGQPPVRVEARPAAVRLHGLHTHIFRYTFALHHSCQQQQDASLYIVRTFFKALVRVYQLSSIFSVSMP